MTGLLMGYARVSTNDQDLTAQKNALAALGGADNTFTDQGLTGANRARPGLREALAACRPPSAGFLAWGRMSQFLRSGTSSGRKLSWLIKHVLRAEPVLA
jgi:DNA invertase Pin-like site-specific DNA recombinase